MQTLLEIALLIFSTLKKVVFQLSKITMREKNTLNPPKGNIKVLCKYLPPLPTGYFLQ